MHYTYKPVGVCSSRIEFDVENGTLRNVVYENGCNGNLKSIGILVEGMKVSDVISKLRGVKCGSGSTSCGDQLAIALEKVSNGEV